MAEAKTINTRIVLRNDTLEAWQGSSKPLLKGEVTLAFSDDGVQVVVADEDGKFWKDLSGNATTIGNLKFKPDNIIGLDNRISCVETNTVYQIVEDTKTEGETGKSYKLQKQEKGTETWIDVEGSRFNIPQFDPTTIESRIGTLETQMSGDAEGSVNKRIEDKGTVLSGYVDTQSSAAETNAKTYANTLCAEISTTVDTNYVKYSDLNSELKDGNKVATMKDIVGLSGSVYIKGTFANKESETGKTDKAAIIETFGNDVKRGAIVINTSNGKEYICMAEIGATTITENDWVEIGDESLYETKADATAKLAEAKGYTDTKISALDAEVTNDSAAKTIDKITEVDGVVSATFKDIAIEQSQVTNLTTDLNNISNWIESVSATAEAELATEVAARTAADNALSDDYVSRIGTAKSEAIASANSYTDSVSAFLSGDYYTQIQAEKSRAEGVEEGLRTDLDTVSTDLDTLEANAILSVKINDQWYTSANNVAEISISCINCGNANS